MLVTCAVEDNALFRAVLDSNTTVKAGEQIFLAPQHEYIRWFDTETGMAV